MTVYVSPKSLDEATSLLADGDYQVLAGGTDLYPAYAGKVITHPIMDIAGINGLKKISSELDHWRIGGMTSWSDLIRKDLPRQFDGLKQAALEVGAKQIQNVGTLAGNLCNASPAADGVPPLLTLNAEVELTSKNEVRRIALIDFISGNRQTEMRPDELLTALIIPKTLDSAASHFQKLGLRSSLVISIVMVASLLDVDEDGIIKTTRISVGACSAVAKRLIELEKALVGVKAKEAAACVKEMHFDCLSPINDILATSGYRLRAAKQLVERSLTVCAGGGA